MSNAIIWDSMVKESNIAKYEFKDMDAWQNKANWRQVPYGTIEVHTFVGSPIVENGNFWLFFGDGGSSGWISQPFFYPNLNGVPGEGAALYGKNIIYPDTKQWWDMYPKYFDIIKNQADEIIFIRDAGSTIGKNVAEYTIKANVGWFEKIPKTEGQYNLGLHSSPQKDVASPPPHEGDTDLIIDKDFVGADHEFHLIYFPENHKFGLYQIRSSYGDNSMLMVIPKDMPSSDLFTIVDWEGTYIRLSQITGYSQMSITNNAMYFGAVNHKNVFVHEDPNIYISAGSSYTTNLKVPIAGKWRISGRINGIYYTQMRDVVAGGNIIFTTPVSGTLQAVVMYLYDRTSLTPSYVNTPMDIYRDIIGDVPVPTIVDNRLRELTPDEVLGDTTWIDVGRLEGVGNYRDVIRFDLSKFNSTDVIEKATLSLLWYYADRNQNTNVKIYRPTNWDADYVTWNTRINGVAWNNPGGDWYDKNNVAQGVEPYDTVTFPAYASPDYKYHDFDVTELVQKYINGTYDNTGFLIKTDEISDDYIAFYSSDWSDINQQPKLNIIVAPPPPPIVIGYEPTGVNVPVTTQISVAFSESMDQSSTESAFTTSPPILGSFSWNSDSTITTFTPATDLASDTIYVVTIGTGARDLAGNYLQSPYSWLFTTVYLDITSPIVIGYEPTGVNVPITTQISVTFSEPMNQPSAESSFLISPATSGSFSWNSDSTIMTFTPASDLAPDTTYMVTIGTGAMDLAGNYLQAPYSWMFITVYSDITPPYSYRYTPTGVNVHTTTQISITFSEPMNQPSTESSFSISPPTLGSFSWNSDSTIMTFTPASDLASNTIHMVTIGTGAMDLAGNYLQTPYSWQFTTSYLDITPPIVTGNAPTGVTVPVTTQISVVFSEDMNQASVESSFLISPATSGSFSWNSDSNIMTFTPASDLAPDTIHMVTIGTGAMDLAGNALQAPYSWQFTTSYLDITPPIVTGNAPTGVTVPVTTQISIAFSEDMNHPSTESSFLISPSTLGRFSWNGNIMTFTPASDLASNTVHMVTIGTGAMDLAGNALQSPYSWDFTTVDIPRGFDPWLLLLPMLPVAALVVTRQISKVR